MFEMISGDGAAQAEPTLTEVCGSEKKSRIQRLRFKMDVAQTFKVAEVFAKTWYDP
jgi:hypothetical protein